MSMQERLFQKIDQLNPAEPYVWRLALSAVEFELLQDTLLQKAVLSGKSSLLEKEWAMRTIVYLAEWYKRCYSSNDSSPAIELNTDDLQTLWSNSGIDQKRFVYTLENGNRSWRYSIYVLGGLAIKLELGKKYLKELCKLYHGDSDKLDNLDDAARAAAFRKSISEQASLYNYFRTILNGKFPFAKEELADKNSEVNIFIKRITSANDEVLRSKFRIEWLFNFSPDSQQISRKLRLWLKPEEIGGTLHQYLRFDRVHLWDIAEPEKIRHLRLGIRFSDGKNVIQPADKDKPLMTYINTGCNETGFLSLGVEKSITLYRVPVKHFSIVEIVVFDDIGNEYVAERIEIEEWWQLFRINPYENEWSSTPQAQHETALLCSAKCQLLDIKDNEFIYQLPFYNKHLGFGQNWFWRPIHDSVSFVDENGKEITLFNRQGYDQITAYLHTDILRYTDSGMVKYYSWNDEYDDHEEEFIPLLLSKDDLIIRHFATKDAIEDAQYEKEILPESVEFLCKGKYCLWDDDAQPLPGKIKLRITIKGREYFYQAFYLPLTIRRDFENCQIILGEKQIQDQLPTDQSPAEPVISKQITQGNDYLLLEIWRPFLRRELICDNKVIRCIAQNERLAVPYILKDEWIIQDFNKVGYRKYFCRDIGNIYNIDGFKSESSANKGALLANSLILAGKLDLLAPEWLDVCFAVPAADNNNEDYFYRWNYVDEPVQVAPDESAGKNEIIFYSVKKSSGNKKITPKIGNFFPFSYPKNIDMVKCFETAVEHRLYFFALEPFKKCYERSEFVQKLYEPLCEKHNGCLTDTVKKGLRRLAAEFSFDWADYEIEL